MAEGDPYFTCENKNTSFDQVLRDMIYEDEDGNPVLHTNPSGTALEKYFNCDTRKNLRTEQVLRDLVLEDADGKPYLNTTS
jgi:hypothetical protein